MTNQQTKYFVLTAAKVRQIKREAARRKTMEAKAKRAARWRFALKFRLFRYRYGLTVNLASNYCGAVCMALKPRPGEDWCRGNDLRDGRFWRLPWVLWDILCYELERGRWHYVRRERAPQFVNRAVNWADREARAQQWPPAHLLEEVAPPPAGQMWH